MRKYIGPTLGLAFVAVNGNAWAGTAVGSLSEKLVVSTSCTVSIPASGATFNYTGPAANAAALSTTVNASVQCSKNTPYALSLGTGTLAAPLTSASLALRGAIGGNSSTIQSNISIPAAINSPSNMTANGLGTATGGVDNTIITVSIPANAIAAGITADTYSATQAVNVYY